MTPTDERHATDEQHATDDRHAGTPAELPVLGGERPARADATRNRQRILAATERLFAERSVNCVTMDEIACAAGVGKGTLFRRFGDRAGLFRAVLDEQERGFQEAFIRGPEPLGPGAPPLERLAAFGHALLDLIEVRGDLLLIADGGMPGLRFRHSVYAAYRAHVTALVREAAPGADADYLADVLLSALSAELVLHQLRAREMPLQRLKDCWDELVVSLCDGPARARPSS
jgi:AcrR family transcriptional regulator